MPPTTLNALARSLGSVNVTVIRANAAGASGEPAERGRERESAQADQQRALATGVVRDPAAEQQQAAEGQRVGGDDPLPVGVRDPEVALRRRQRDVHDGRVEDDHELGRGDHGQR
jgi:hypothetical protein